MIAANITFRTGLLLRMNTARGTFFQGSRHRGCAATGRRWRPHHTAHRGHHAPATRRGLGHAQPGDASPARSGWRRGGCGDRHRGSFGSGQRGSFGSGRCGSCHNRLGGGRRCRDRFGGGRSYGFGSRRCGSCYRRLGGDRFDGGARSGRRGHSDATGGSSGQANSEWIGSHRNRTRRCAGSGGLDSRYRHRSGGERLGSWYGRGPGGGRQYHRLQSHAAGPNPQISEPRGRRGGGAGGHNGRAGHRIPRDGGGGGDNRQGNDLPARQTTRARRWRRLLSMAGRRDDGEHRNGNDAKESAH